MKRRNFLTAIILSTILFLGGVSSYQVHAQIRTGDAPTTPPAPKEEKSQAFTLDLKINNPLEVDNIQDAIKLGLNFVMKIAIPIIIVLFIWSGFLFVFALGNKDKIAIAKKNFLYTLIGAGLVLGAYTIAIAIINTVNSLS